jgi:hypothetical protein
VNFFNDCICRFVHEKIGSPMAEWMRRLAEGDGPLHGRISNPTNTSVYK